MDFLITSNCGSDNRAYFEWSVEGGGWGVWQQGVRSCAIGAVVGGPTRPIRSASSSAPWSRWLRRPALLDPGGHRYGHHGGSRRGSPGWLRCRHPRVLVLIMLFFGFTQWNWFSAQPGPAQNPAVSSPAPSGGGGGASPMASPSK
jgi:hypothetical protein